VVDIPEIKIKENFMAMSPNTVIGLPGIPSDPGNKLFPLFR
jgi:hypothetical protein